jgi:hypothetical protein
VNWPTRRREQQLERELNAHLELEAEELREAGLPEEESRLAARRAASIDPMDALRPE